MIIVFVVVVVVNKLNENKLYRVEREEIIGFKYIF